MNTLKVRVRAAVGMARLARQVGMKGTAAHWLDRAGEIRRSAFYLYR